jgi:hypothetical protein
VVTTFLFAIFGSFQSREAFIITFGNRSGAPPSAVDAILGAAKLGTLDRVLEIGESAQVWMAQVLETHLAYPVLIFFRSTHDGLSWVGTLGGLLDSATLVLTTLDHPQSGDAALLLRLGRHVVDDISDYFDLVDTGATGIERSEFYQAYDTFRLGRLQPNARRVREPAQSNGDLSQHPAAAMGQRSFPADRPPPPHPTGCMIAALVRVRGYGMQKRDLASLEAFR